MAKQNMFVLGTIVHQNELTRDLGYVKYDVPDSTNKVYLTAEDEEFQRHTGPNVKFYPSKELAAVDKLVVDDIYEVVEKNSMVQQIVKKVNL